MNANTKDTFHICVNALNNCEVGLAEWCIVYHLKNPELSVLEELLQNIEEELDVAKELSDAVSKEELLSVLSEAHVEEILGRISTCKTANENCHKMIERMRRFRSRTDAE